ncbi:hypothetical protein Barb6XT_01640 [Bacteroidales bacterium Barb6XT]|nr:hypothetical protein Barb6XT_01640 [Bacteroidales bacterium Barb6XT]
MGEVVSHLWETTARLWEAINCKGKSMELLKKAPAYAIKKAAPAGAVFFLPENLITPLSGGCAYEIVAKNPFVTIIHLFFCTTLKYKSTAILVLFLAGTYHEAGGSKQSKYRSMQYRIFRRLPF